MRAVLRTASRVILLAVLAAITAAVRAHRRDMRRMRETDVYGDGFRAARAADGRGDLRRALDERYCQVGSTLPNGHVPTLAELRERREGIWVARWRPEELLDAELAEQEKRDRWALGRAWWERTWPEPDRLEDQGGGGDDRATG